MAQQYTNTIDLALHYKIQGRFFNFSIFQVYNHIMRCNGFKKWEKIDENTILCKKI